MRGISKHFGSVAALEEVGIAIRQGGIHAIVGENGAGKTTLMRILYGAIPPDRGEILIDGQPAAFRSSRDAIAARIGMVSQHYAIIPELSALQNLVLGAESGILLRLSESRARARELAERMGFDLDWDAPAGDLSPAEAQKLEILKLLWRNSRIMILDEPTAMLSPADSQALFESLHRLAAEGNTILLVTHRLPEVLDHAAHVTVLRGGRVVADAEVAATDAAQLTHWIVGRSLTRPSVPHSSPGEVLLSVKDLSAKSDRHLHHVSFEVRRREMVGIAGVDGSGQRELFEAIAGTLPSLGTITLMGHAAGSTAARIGQGLRIIPEDRHEQGLVESWSLEMNAALGLQRTPLLSTGFRVDRGQRHQWAEAIGTRFATKFDRLSQPISDLSGGNQQRFVAGRALAIDPKLILAFQPARGLDLGATAEVFAALRATCDQGAGALVVSFDLDELLDHCDRILVMHRGSLVESHKDREAIGRLMVGAG